MGAHALKGCVQVGVSSVRQPGVAGPRRAARVTPGDETTMKTLIRAVALAGLLAAGAAQAEPDPAFATTTLNLSAHGETAVTPDEATITLGVQTKAGGAGAAMAQNAQRMSAVITALRGAGITEKDIRTSNLSLAAQYDYAPNTAPRLNGYQASNDVTVTIKDLARLGPAIDAVTNAGANQINGIGFGLKSAQAAEDAARVQAVKALRAKAELYAEASGYHIVRLISLTESGDGGYQPVRPMAMAMAKSAVQGVPVSAGELTVRADVSAVFELAR